MLRFPPDRFAETVTNYKLRIVRVEIHTAQLTSYTLPATVGTQRANLAYRSVASVAMEEAAVLAGEELGQPQHADRLCRVTESETR